MARLFFLHFTLLEQKSSGDTISKKESEPFFINDETKFWYTLKFLAELLTRENAPEEERDQILDVLVDMAYKPYLSMALGEILNQNEALLATYLAGITREQMLRFGLALAEKVMTVPAADFATWYVEQLKKPMPGGFTCVP